MNRKSYIHVRINIRDVLAQKDHRSDLSYADAKKVFGMAETSKKHDRELRRKEKNAAREARHNARESAGSS